MNKLLEFKSVAKRLNDLTYTDYFYRLMLLARSMFEWSGLPNGIDQKWIEKYLFTEGVCVFFNDPEKGFMVAKTVLDGQLNYYDEPTTVRAYGTNYEGTSHLLNNVDCVLIRNNEDMIPTSYTIQLFATQLTRISRVIDVNINSQKTPILIKCSDKEKLSLKNVYSQWNENEPVIYGTRDLDIEKFEVLRTDAPVVFDKLQIQKHEIWNECMTFLGINNANTNKRERLITDEVMANNELVDLSAKVMLETRKRACEQINKIFGTNIDVKLRKIEAQNDDLLDLGGDL